MRHNCQSFSQRVGVLSINQGEADELGHHTDANKYGDLHVACVPGRFLIGYDAHFQVWQHVDHDPRVMGRRGKQHLLVYFSRWS